MFKKKINSLYLVIFLTSLVLLLIGCDYQGNTNINQAPEVYITSFTGRDSELEAGLDAVVYQQKIYWYGKDIDGVITGYAYRILDEVGNPIATAGNEYISGFMPELSTVDPSSKGGWVLHYKKGTSEDYPLYDTRTQTTIWTDKIFTEINFPSADTNGNLLPRASSFEIVAIDNRDALSKVAKKYFFAKSGSPSILISTSKGLLDTLSTNLSDSKALGQGVRMIFTMPDQRIGIITNKPWYYRYRIYQVADGQNLDDVAAATKWYSTRYLTNPSEVVLKGIGYSVPAPPLQDENEIWNAVPALRSNFVDNLRQSYSVIDVQVVDMAGVHSSIEPVVVNGATVRRFRKFFLVNDKYNPAAFVYFDRIYALGNNHFSREDHPDIPRMVVEPPKSYTNTGTRVAQLLFPTPLLNENKELDGFEWQLIGDALTRFWIRWGYNGEYPNNNPHAEKSASNIYFDRVLDSRTDINYGSEISDYYISLDGMRYPYPPLMVAGLQDHTYYDYLKVPANHEIAQLFIRSSLAPGKHVVKIRVEDLQNVVSEPDSIVFNILTKKTPDQRRGVLYIDYASTNATQKTNIKNYYTSLLGELNKDFTYLNRLDVFNARRGTKYHNWRQTGNLFPITLLDKYECVIVATDQVSGNFDAFEDAEGFVTYLLTGGKVILIGNQNMVGLSNAKPAYEPQFLRNYFGFPPNTTGSPTSVEGLSATQFYFKGATPVAPETQYLNPETTTAPEANALRYEALRSVSCLVNTEGLHPRTQVLYRFDCLPEGTYTNPSNPAQTMTVTGSDYAKYHNKPIGIKYTPENPSQGTAFTFTVPLYHLERGNVKYIFSNHIFR